MTAAEKQRIERLVETYRENQSPIERFHRQLLYDLNNSVRLQEVAHSIRSRLKDPEHLREKLIRKLNDSSRDGRKFDIEPDNLCIKVNDLVGIRILHLHTRQILPIDSAIREIIREQGYKLVERPFARTWDDESRTFFRDHKIKTEKSPSLYTSVHYVLGSASRVKLTAEIQVRTLMEEVWGEVDHKFNYPKPSAHLACREQIKVLARVTSSATRLVDAIFATNDDHEQSSTSAATKRRRSQR